MHRRVLCADAWARTCPGATGPKTFLALLAFGFLDRPGFPGFPGLPDRPDDPDL